MENQWILAEISISGLLTILFAVIFFFKIRHVKEDRHKEIKIEKAVKNIKTEEPEKSQEEQKKKLQLAEHCCDIREEIAERLAEEPYETLFLKYAPFYQGVIGLKRQAEREGMTAALFAGAILLDAENMNIELALGADGFRVSEKKQSFEREKLRTSCLKLSISALEYQIRLETEHLQQLRQKLPYREIILGTGAMAADMIQKAKREEMDTCIQDIKKIEDCLVQCGCFILFFDAPQVKKSEELRVDFEEDAPMATELPGFYTFSERQKKYYLLGTCAGTRRRSQ